MNESSINDYLAKAQKEVKDNIELLQASMNIENEHDKKMEIAIARYHYAQLLSSLGMQRDSLIWYRQAWDSACNYIPTLSMIMKDQVTAPMMVYSRVAYSIGVDYVIVLDYLSENAECDRVFDFLNNSVFNEGPHLGDFAFYLHRRRRDFDNAER